MTIIGIIIVSTIQIIIILITLEELKKDVMTGKDIKSLGREGHNIYCNPKKEIDFREDKTKYKVKATETKIKIIDYEN